MSIYARSAAMLVAVLLCTSAFGQRYQRSDPARVAAPSGEVTALFQVLREFPLHEQRKQLWGLTSDVKSALWVHNLQEELRSTEWNDEQRKTIMDAIKIVRTPGWFSIDKSSPLWTAKMAGLDELKQSARSNFAPAEILRLFLRLGVEPQNADATAQGIIDPGDPPCNCLNWYECWFLGQGCALGAACEPTQHCGFFNNEECIGKCKYGA